MSFGSNSSGFSCHFSGGNFGLVNQTPVLLLQPLRRLTNTHADPYVSHLEEREAQYSECAAGLHHFGELEDVEAPVVGPLEQLE